MPPLRRSGAGAQRGHGPAAVCPLLSGGGRACGARQPAHALDPRGRRSGAVRAFLSNAFGAGCGEWGGATHHHQQVCTIGYCGFFIRVVFLSCVF